MDLMIEALLIKVLVEIRFLPDVLLKRVHHLLGILLQHKLRGEITNTSVLQQKEKRKFHLGITQAMLIEVEIGHQHHDQILKIQTAQIPTDVGIAEVR